MQRKELLKRSSIRYAEYYGMVEVQDALYKDSADGKIFTKLIEVISSDANIKMAYRNRMFSFFKMPYKRKRH